MVRIGKIELGEFPLLLAPMEDVSDPPFRYVCKMMGADLMYTEFISSEGLIRDAAKSMKKLDIFDYERPMGVQLFGGSIEVMKAAAEIAERVKPDLIDINYGCPVKAVACKGAGAALLQDIPKLVKMTEEVVKSVKLPVTVKTRLGWDDNTKNIVEVAERLQDIGIQAIAIHGRTRKQMYKGPADWTLIGEVKNNPRMCIPVFGNGDVDSPEKVKHVRDTYGVDGVMIGRASIGNPWVFSEIKQHLIAPSLTLPQGMGDVQWTSSQLELKQRGVSIQERVRICRLHLQKAMEWKGEKLGIIETRSHYGGYFRGVPDFKEYRTRLVTANTLEEIYQTLNEVEERFAVVSA